MPEPRNLKNNLILAFVSTLASLVLLVAAIEVFYGYGYENWRSEYAKNGNWYGGLTTKSENPVLMWEYRPDSEFVVLGNRIRTNQYGFRDDDYESVHKPTNVFRVAFIGDSVTLGLGVDERDVFVRKFAAYASDLPVTPKMESMNFGIDGYNIIQISEHLKSSVLRFAPDKVVYVMCLNDFDFEESSGGKTRYFKKPRSFTLELIERAYRRLRDIEFHTWHFEKNREQAFDAILTMKTLLDTQGIDFQIVILPIFKFEGADRDFHLYPLFEMHSEISRVLIENDLDFIDLLELFRDQESAPQHFAHSLWHPNEEGHDLIARKLLEFIRPD